MAVAILAGLAKQALGTGASQLLGYTMPQLSSIYNEFKAALNGDKDKIPNELEKSYLRQGADYIGKFAANLLKPTTDEIASQVSLPNISRRGHEIKEILLQKYNLNNYGVRKGMFIKTNGKGFNENDLKNKSFQGLRGNERKQMHNMVKINQKNAIFKTKESSKRKSVIKNLIKKSKYK